MKSTRYKETEDQMSIKNYGGSNHKTEYDYDEKKWWDEIQTSNSHKQWTPKLKETSSPYATMCTPRLGVMMMMIYILWWSVCVCVTKNDHFPKRPVCGFRVFSR